jgi:N-acetyl-gamma-glutamyl-phosphate reductase
MAKKSEKSVDRLRVGVLGASGYTGAELLRLLAGHDGYEIAFLTADRHAGKPMASVFPHLSQLALPDLIALGEVDWGRGRCYLLRASPWHYPGSG